MDQEGDEHVYTGADYANLIETIKQDCFLMIVSKWSADEIIPLEENLPQLTDRIDEALKNTKVLTGSVSGKKEKKEVSKIADMILRCGPKLTHFLFKVKQDNEEDDEKELTIADLAEVKKDFMKKLAKQCPNITAFGERVRLSDKELKLVADYAELLRGQCQLESFYVVELPEHTFRLLRNCNAIESMYISIFELFKKYSQLLKELRAYTTKPLKKTIKRFKVRGFGIEAVRFTNQAIKLLTPEATFCAVYRGLEKTKDCDEAKKLFDAMYTAKVKNDGVQIDFLGDEFLRPKLASPIVTSICYKDGHGHYLPTFKELLKFNQLRYVSLTRGPDSVFTLLRNDKALPNLKGINLTHTECASNFDKFLLTRAHLLKGYQEITTFQHMKTIKAINANLTTVDFLNIYLRHREDDQYEWDENEEEYTGEEPVKEISENKMGKRFKETLQMLTELANKPFETRLTIYSHKLHKQIKQIHHHIKGDKSKLTLEYDNMPDYKHWYI